MNNYERISEKIKKSAPEVPEMPESLSKENVIKMLREKEIAPKKRVKILPRMAAVAAMLAIVAVSAFTVNYFDLFEKVPNFIDATTEVLNDEEITEAEGKNENSAAAKLQKLQTEGELKSHIKSLIADKKKVDSYNEWYAAVEDGVAEMAPSATVQTKPVQSYKQESVIDIADDMGGLGDSSGSEGSNHGTTNLQVEGVEEADIIKNDGRYLYIVSYGAYTCYMLKIVDTETMTVLTNTPIILEGRENPLPINDIYVNGNTLVAICDDFEGELTGVVAYNESNGAMLDVAYPNYGSSKTVSIVYDITDRANIKKINEISQDGSVISTRMNGSVLYTLSRYTVYSEEKYKPEVNGEGIECDCIYILDKNSTTYTLLTAYDTKDPKAELKTTSIIGNSTEAYCTKDTLYVASAIYKNDNKGRCTDVYAFTLNGTEIAYKTSGRVKGIALNQFSFDEYEGYLRIATTDFNYEKGLDISSVYILNEDLKIVGELVDIAKDEQVKSVRFMGNIGYVVTFRNTDPLFVIDLKDPKNPKITGELKLPGYSSYLHPVGEGYMVGLGYDGDEENADTESVKISVFDVRDPKAPKETDNLVIKHAVSSAQYNHKAFVVNKAEGYIAIPVENNMYYEDSGEFPFTFEVFEIKEGKIKERKTFAHTTDDKDYFIFRGTYIGNKIYTISTYAVIEYELSSGAETRRVKMKSDYEKDLIEKYDFTTTPPYYKPADTLTTAVTN